MKKLLVTGSSGLIGSQVCQHFSDLGWDVHGVDNNQREIFFGPGGSTRWNQERPTRNLRNFHHHEVDIRDRNRVLDLVLQIGPDAVVHGAAQPSHDKAAEMPFEDFDINAVGTFNLVEATRQYWTDIPFVHQHQLCFHSVGL